MTGIKAVWYEPRYFSLKGIHAGILYWKPHGREVGIHGQCENGGEAAGEERSRVLRDPDGEHRRVGRERGREDPHRGGDHRD
ncbi:MAG TPA: hypothetical protein DD658_07955, partial [Deltaproteobacteria bacterium]|nr:hypothetical protein [Deltaproteobacteria bacterium]